MARLAGWLTLGLTLAANVVCAQKPNTFTLRDALSAPVASLLTAAPAGNLFAWVENSEGRHNLFVGGPQQPARQLTHSTADDAQEIGQIAWSPDGKMLAYVLGAEAGSDGKPANPAHLQPAPPVEVWLVAADASASPLRLGEGHSPLFAPLNHRLLFVRSGQIWSANLDLVCSPAAACAIDLPAPVSHQLVFDRGAALQLTLSPDAATLAFISRRAETKEPAHSFLALFDLRTDTLSFPAASTSNDSAPAFSPDGRSLAWLRAPFTQAAEFAPNRTSPNPWSIQLLDLATATTRTLFSPEANQRGSVLPHLSDSEPRLFFRSPHALDFFSEADGWVHLYELDPGGEAINREVKWMTPGPAEADDVIFSKDQRSLFYVSNLVARDVQDADRRHIWHLDLTQPDLLPVQLTTGAGIETHLAVASDGTLAALISDARTPMHPALIAKDGAMTSLHASANPSSYPAARFVDPQQVLFDSSDHVHLHAQLFLPVAPASGRRPAIVFVHGGPRRQMLLGYPSGGYYSNAYALNQYLVARGFVVLSLNYRCGTGYGLDFRQCLHGGADGALEYNDVLAAAKYLRGRADVDATRVGIWGGSYGGYLTALALARNSNLFAAGVDFHGVHNWNLEDNAGDWKLGDAARQDAIGAKALASSPLADLSHWSSPILLIHGDDDPDVAYAQTPTLAEALRSHSVLQPDKPAVDVEELIFPDEVHGFLLHRDWLAAYQATAAFFERTLRP